jgi:hypothetical protein
MMDYVHTSQETHYVYATSPTGYCELWICNDGILMCPPHFWIFIHNPIFYLKPRWIMFVLHRKHITSTLPAQQVNAIFRLVAMVY